MSMRSWWKRPRPDDEDLDREIRAHLAIAEDERIAEGSDRETAHFAALKDFGNVTLTTEAARRVWTPRWVEAGRDLVSDVRYAIRALARNRGILTRRHRASSRSASASTPPRSRCSRAWRSTPSPASPGRRDLAVVLNETSTGRQVSLSYPDYEYLRDHDRAFTGLIGSRNVTVNLGSGLGAEPIIGELGDRQLLPAAGRARPAGPHAAAVGRDRARPASGRRPQRQPVEASVRAPIATSSAR